MDGGDDRDDDDGDSSGDDIDEDEDDEDKDDKDEEEEEEEHLASADSAIILPSGPEISIYLHLEAEDERLASVHCSTYTFFTNSPYHHLYYRLLGMTFPCLAAPEEVVICPLLAPDSEGRGEFHARPTEERGIDLGSQSCCAPTSVIHRIICFSRGAQDSRSSIHSEFDMVQRVDFAYGDRLISGDNMDGGGGEDYASREAWATY
ncbi:hypothetical protein Tco_0033168 [Tanacetum coccineum]